MTVRQVYDTDFRGHIRNLKSVDNLYQLDKVDKRKKREREREREI